MNVRNAASSLSTGMQLRVLRPVHAQNAGGKSTSRSAADPDSLSGETPQKRLGDKVAAVRWNRPAKPVAVEMNVVRSRRVEGGREMTPILAILFALCCIALEAFFSRSEHTAKAKGKIRRDAPKA